jgi:hypothetical protein
LTGLESPEKQAVRDFVARCNAAMAAAARSPAATAGPALTDPFSLLSPDVIVTINGTTPLSGRFPGFGLVRGILLDSARVVIHSLEVEIGELIAKGSRVAALLKLSGRTSRGTAFNEEGRLCSCVFSVTAGRIEEIALFADTSLIEIALYGRRYAPDV